MGDFTAALRKLTTAKAPVELPARPPRPVPWQSAPYEPLSATYASVVQANPERSDARSTIAGYHTQTPRYQVPESAREPVSMRPARDVSSEMSPPDEDTWLTRPQFTESSTDSAPAAGSQHSKTWRGQVRPAADRPMQSTAPSPQELAVRRLPAMRPARSSRGIGDFSAARRTLVAGDFRKARARRRLAAAVGGFAPSHDPEGISLIDRAIPTGMRVGGAIAGSVLGSVGGVPGMVVGGGIGGGVGEYGAEQYEVNTGQRRTINPLQVATQTGLSAIPIGRVPGVGTTIERLAQLAATLPARRTAQGAGLGAASAVATELAESGELPSPGQVGTAAVLGGTVGYGGGRLERTGLQARIAREAPDQIVGRYASRPVRGLLPAGRTPIVTEPPPGSVPEPQPDASFVRGVPAEYARRDVRGLLPGGRAQFLGSETGPAVPIARADEPVPEAPRAPAQSFARGVPAAPIARTIDPTRLPHEAIRVSQFSGDVDAPAVPLIDDDARQLLEAAGQDLRALPAQRGRLIRDPHDPGFSIFAHGGAGTKIGDDIRAISGTRAGNDVIEKARQDVLAGKPPTSKLHVAWLDWVENVKAGTPDYHRPQIAAAEARAVAAQAAEAGGGDADDFARFEAAFDDISSTPYTPEPGERGSIAGQLAVHGGSALGGAAIGATQGDTPQERLEHAIVFGLAGAAAPSALMAAVRRMSPRAKTVLAETITDPAWAQSSPSAKDTLAGLIRAGQGDTAAMKAASRVLGPDRMQQRWRSGAPMADPMARMDPFIGKFHPLIQSGIRERIEAHGGYEAQRRGTIDTPTLGRFANEVRVNAAKVLPKGTTLNAEQVTAYARALQKTHDDIEALTRRINAGTATDAEILQLQRTQADTEIVTASLMGARTEAGRALAAFRFLDSVLETGDVTLIRGVADSVRGQARELAAQFATLPNDPIARYRWLQQHGKPTLWDKARSIFYGNILSGLKTHERNILGNVANMLTEFAVHPAAVGADVVRSAVKGTPRTVTLDEFPASVVGMLAGIERGWDAMLFTARYGVSPDSLRRSLSAAETGKLDIPRVELGGGGANPFNWPGRALDSADAFFRTVTKQTELHRLAHQQAVREGLRGEAFTKRMTELVTGTVPGAASLHEQAAEYARRAVFQEKPGKLASWVIQGHHVPVVKHVLPFVLPFVKTPANIFRQGLEFSPAGALMRAARQGGRAGAQAQGRVALGTAAAGYLAWLAASDRLSGNGPSDRTDRAALMERGWRPNSVKIGDEWVSYVSYQLFQPVSVQAAIIANAVEAWRSGGSRAEDVSDILAQTFARSANSFLEQSFFTGLFNFVDAIKDPERSASRVLGRTASGAVPFVGALRTAQQAMDPVVRVPKTAAEHFKAGLPGLSEDIRPRINRKGEIVTREGGPLRRAADPFNVASEQHDPVLDEIDRLRASDPDHRFSMAAPTGRIALPAGMELSEADTTAYQQEQGRSTYAVLKAVMDHPSYTSLDDDERRTLLDAAERRLRTGLSRRKKTDVITKATRAPRDGDEKPIPGIRGGIAVYQGGRWIRKQ